MPPNDTKVKDTLCWRTNWNFTPPSYRSFHLLLSASSQLQYQAFVQKNIVYYRWQQCLSEKPLHNDTFDIRNLNIISYKLIRIVTATLNLILLPRARMCSKDRFLSICLSVTTKIARSGNLGIWATSKYNKPDKVVEKLASLCFESLGKAYKHGKHCAFIGHAYRLDPLRPCAFCSCAQPSNT